MSLLPLVQTFTLVLIYKHETVFELPELVYEKFTKDFDMAILEGMQTLLEI